MSELTHEEKVKKVGGDNDMLCIELFNGMQLMGPMKTKPIPRQPVAELAADAAGDLAAPIAAAT